MRKFGVLFGIRMSIFIYKKKNYRKKGKKKNKTKTKTKNYNPYLFIN